VKRDELESKLRPGQVVIDLVNLEKGRRLKSTGAYAGICW
jgi:hypothetical protein